MNEIREQVDVHSNKPQHVVGTHGSCVRSPRSKWTSGHTIGADARAVRPYMRHAHKESKAKEYLPYKLEIMNREQKERLHYIVPRCTVIPMQNDCLLQAVSGQHEHIGQGGTFGNAKRGSDEEWEEEVSSESLTPNPSPKREGSDYPSYNVWGE